MSATDVPAGVSDHPLGRSTFCGDCALSKKGVAPDRKHDVNKAKNIVRIGNTLYGKCIAVKFDLAGIGV